MTPLYAAAINRHITIGEALLSHGATVDVKNKNNNSTPLHLAVLNNDEDFVALLLRFRARIDVENAGGDTPLSLALEKRFNETGVRFRLQLAQVASMGSANARDAMDRTPLHLAAHRDALEAVQRLVFRGASVHDRDANGWTALHFASEVGGIKIARFLLTERCSTDVRDREGRTAVDIAALNGHLDVVRELSSQGSSLRGVSSGGRTILHLAVLGTSRVGNGGSRGVSDGDRNGNGGTRGDSDSDSDNNRARVLEYLLRQSLDANAADDDGYTPLHCAVQACAGRSDTASASTSTTTSTSLDVLLSADGVDVDARSHQHETPLLVSAKLGLVDAASKLVAAGADVDAQDRAGESSLLVASARGDADVVHLLLQHGARTDSATPSGRTPLTVAATADIRSMLQLYHNSQQFHERCLAHLSGESALGSPLDATELASLVPLITSVYDLRLLLSLVSLAPVMPLLASDSGMKETHALVAENRAAIHAVSARVDTLQAQVVAGRKVLEQVVTRGNQIARHVTQLQQRLAQSEKNIVRVASSLQQLRSAYVSRLEQEEKTKKIKMVCGLLAATVGFVFAPVLKEVFDSAIDLASPFEVFLHAVGSEADVVKFLTDTTGESVLKPLVQSKLEELAIPKDAFESVLREALVLTHPELVTQAAARGLVLDVAGSGSGVTTAGVEAVRRLESPLETEADAVRAILGELQRAVAATDTETAAGETAPHRHPRGGFRFVDDIEAFPHHSAVMMSGGDLEVFRHCVDTIASEAATGDSEGGTTASDPTATIAVRVMQTVTTTLCAAEYAYRRGYHAIGDFFAARMGRKPSSFDTRAALSVELLEDADIDADGGVFAFICAVDMSDGDVELCQSLCDDVDDVGNGEHGSDDDNRDGLGSSAMQMLEARIRVRVVVELGSDDGGNNNNEDSRLS
ncbi:hypothetical protein PybrP1_005177 [[Pythium] brassicae (nom. inval.)]|nr:hypothetical protein PybrP1_005177 [[Pythium] brassicae (nom. inval.)]